ncbi:TMV resistance protein N-like, partial [Trifolium medium]|nr:TMV resistance protein N-like [Trifolium medium]
IMGLQDSFTYDVYLSFRGEDTRYGFTGNLYAALNQRGIHTFTDELTLLQGEEISSSLLHAIEKSKIAIIIFSPNYASSRWCLDELTKILDCYEENKTGRLVLPVFYKVDPSNVRRCRGRFGETLAKLEDRFNHDEERVNKWRDSLRKAASLAGFHFGYSFIFN